MNEPFIIDHDNPKKIKVFNDIDMYSGYRYPIKFNKNGSVLCVDGACESNEKKYLNGTTFNASCWERWQQIPEPKFRPMTWEEALPILEKAWILYCTIGGNNWMRAVSIDLKEKEFFLESGRLCLSEYHLRELKYKISISDEPKKFEVEVKE